MFVIVILALSLVATPVFAGGKGAVKADLNDVDVTGDAVGSVIFNTTADGMLNILVNMDSRVIENYVIRLWWNSPPYGANYTQFVQTISTNAQGQGNIQLKAVIPFGMYGVDPTDETVDVQIAMRPFNFFGNPSYWTPHTVVALK